MLIEFTLSVYVDPKGKDDCLSDDQSEGLNSILSDLEEVFGKNDLDINDAGWREV